MTSLNLSKIGCSDYPTLFGANPYSSTFALQQRLLGRGEPERSAALRESADWGLAMERPVFDRWCHLRELKPGKVIENLSREPEFRAWQRYTPDVVLPIPASVQIKTISTRRFAREGWGHDDTDQVPDRIRFQVIGELEAMRADAAFWQDTHGVDPFAITHADVAVCEIQYGRLALHTYRVPFVQSFAEMMVVEAERFWRDHVIGQKPVEPDGSESATEMLESEYPEAVEEHHLSTPADEDLMREYSVLKSELDRLGERKSEIENLMRQRIGQAKGVRGEGWRANWYQRAGSTKWKDLAASLRGDRSDEEWTALEAAHRGKGSRVLSITIEGE